MRRGRVYVKCDGCTWSFSKREFKNQLKRVAEQNVDFDLTKGRMVVDETPYRLEDVNDMENADAILEDL
jgi:uncharacterized protein (DUF2225 family)